MHDHILDMLKLARRSSTEILWKLENVLLYKRLKGNSSSLEESVCKTQVSLWMSGLCQELYLMATIFRLSKPNLRTSRLLFHQGLINLQQCSDKGCASVFTTTKPSQDHFLGDGIWHKIKWLKYPYCVLSLYFGGNLKHTYEECCSGTENIVYVLYGLLVSSIHTSQTCLQFSITISWDHSRKRALLASKGKSQCKTSFLSVSPRAVHTLDSQSDSP